ncbi:glycosyltransferase [Variovorax sp. NFACC27]|uniref:glycosyltransferase n=1 Tax=unclassified Variovorax TaxID=663243 RepID=UPI0008989FD4|nr:Glycosyl transferase family 2 [Variovorax sp. NFACC28]SEG89763.1 Glycosyl transferase family 2 [Variovorax sp. NFACC29]SFD39703.1 Glycosyl transferase family 2 [Variovorax sp. NFACC26]SFG42101.1 Glycosyl transferase family 2 [Variovorax sp. NFACC27]
MGERQKISGVVISYNRADVIEATLRSLWFVDELIVVDKSSTDGTAELASKIADRVIIEPWRPLGEDSRQSAVNVCTHDWIACMDDDECFSIEAGQYIQKELEAPTAGIYIFPLRHYILGTHDEEAYYWPDRKPRMFRRDAVSFRSTVHNEWNYRVEDCTFPSAEDGICIHHLSHKDAATWIEKTNKYTSQNDRHRMFEDDADLIAFAHRQIDQHFAQSKTQDRTGYAAAVSVLRSLYDIVDRVKGWEEDHGIDGAKAFREFATHLESTYPARERKSPVASTLRERKRWNFLGR